MIMLFWKRFKTVSSESRLKSPLFVFRTFTPGFFAAQVYIHSIERMGGSDAQSTYGADDQQEWGHGSLKETSRSAWRPRGGELCVSFGGEWTTTHDDPAATIFS